MRFPGLRASVFRFRKNVSTPRTLLVWLELAWIEMNRSASCWLASAVRLQWHEGVLGSGHHDFSAHLCFDKVFQPPGDIQHQFFFGETRRADAAGIVSAMPGIDDHAGNLQTETADQRTIAATCRLRGSHHHAGSAMRWLVAKAGRGNWRDSSRGGRCGFGGGGADIVMAGGGVTFADLRRLPAESPVAWPILVATSMIRRSGILQREGVTRFMRAAVQNDAHGRIVVLTDPNLLKQADFTGPLLAVQQSSSVGPARHR